MMILCLFISILIIPAYAYSCSEQGTCCTPGVNCPPCLAPQATKQRVRRDLKTLSIDQFKKIAHAIWRLKRRKNGKTYDYFVAKHTVTNFDSRVNQGHFGSHFIGYHAMIVLEFEKEILKIDPTIEALPYWDFSTLSKGDGKALEVFARFFGSAPGTGDNYQVIDGYFPKFPVAKMNTSVWEGFNRFRRSVGPMAYSTYTPDTTSGYLRDPQNENMNPYLTRYQSWIFDPVGGTCVLYDPDPYTVPWEGMHPFCTHASENGTLISWYFCVEVSDLNIIYDDVTMLADICMHSVFLFQEMPIICTLIICTYLSICVGRYEPNASSRPHDSR